MAKITWLGEDIGEQAGPSFTTWNGIKFPKGKAVEVTNEHMIGKARGNRFFKVSGEEPKQAQWTKDEIAAAEKARGQPVVAKKEPEHVTQPEKAEPPKAETQKSSGYTPAKKKVRKPAAAHHRAHR